MPVNLGDYASKFTTQLDTIIERESLTSDLGNGGLLGEFTDAGEVKVPDIVVEGLADYSRTDGFVSGGYTSAGRLTSFATIAVESSASTSSMTRNALRSSPLT